jgi:Flp pilus assembly protein TadB
MLLSWIILVIGIEIGIRTETLTQVFSIASTNKLRFNCYFATWIVSFLIFWSGFSAFSAWYIVMLALILLPALKIGLRFLRKNQIPARALAFLDMILLNMKAGQSFRKSFSLVMESERSWFTSFQLSLLKSLESGSVIETESDWFNHWASEIVQIEKSRNKVVEQLEVLRRYLRQELTFKKKIKNAAAGPRAQVFVMSILFAALNAFAVRNLSHEQMKTLLPVAWFLFLIGIVVVILIMRSFKWKV